MKSDLCGICAGVGEVSTMGGFETCPSCRGRGFEQLRFFLKKNDRALELAVEAIQLAFKRRNK